MPQVRKSKAYSEARKELNGAGYNIAEIVLDASRCGVPQARRRFFALGSLRKDAMGKFEDSCARRMFERKLTVKEHLGGMIDIEFYYRHPRNYSRRSVFSVHEPSPTIRGVNRPVPPGYKGNHLDSAPPSEARALTSFERSLIQTFPESWEWQAGNRNGAVEIQIGNAVPVNLAAFVAEGIIEANGK